jgi:hypothetical protein
MLTSKRLAEYQNADLPRRNAILPQISTQPKSKPKSITESNAKSRNSFTHLICGCSRESSTEEQLSGDEILAFSGKPASDEQNALLDGGEEDFFFDFENGFRLCGGVLVPVDFQPELCFIRQELKRGERRERTNIPAAGVF